MPVITFSEYVLMTPGALDDLREAYLEDVTRGGTWGAEVEARHLAEIFGVTVMFWTEDRDRNLQTAHHYGTGRRTLHLLNSGNHFEAFRVAPTAGTRVSRDHVATNGGGGDCLFRAFHQALRRNDEEPSLTALTLYRELVASSMRREPELDLEGLLVTLLDDFTTWGFALGAGPILQRAMFTLYTAYARSDVEGGGSIPPFGRKQRDDLVIGMRDFVPRGELSRADRMLDRIGRLIATATSVHVAVALDGNAIVMSPNSDTLNVRAALVKLITRYGQSDLGVDEDPMHGALDSTLRVKRDTVFGGTLKTRRQIDINKLKALESGVLEELESGITLDKLKRIKAALLAGLLTDEGGSTAKAKYLGGATGVYLIPHVVVPKGVVHGEMNVTDAVQERRQQELDRKNPLEDDVFIGGTLIDCFDCNKAHQSRNEALRLKGHAWRFYSGGTHGNSFPNWYLTPEIQGNIDTGTFDRERFPGGRVVEWWDDHDTTTGHYGYDTDVVVGSYFYFDRYRNKHYTSQAYSPSGYRNRYEEWTETRLVWQPAPKSFLIDLFLREKDDTHINNTHSSFADDSDSDTEDYPVLIREKRTKIRKRRKRLIKSYAGTRDVRLCDVLTGHPELSLSITRPGTEDRPLLSSALWLYTRLPSLPIVISTMSSRRMLTGGRSTTVPSTTDILVPFTGGETGRSSPGNVTISSTVVRTAPRSLDSVAFSSRGGDALPSTGHALVPTTRGASTRALRAMAMVFFTDGTAPSEASMFLPDVDLYELLTGFSQDRLGELFELALGIDLPSRRAPPSNAVAQLRGVGARYQVQVRPMGNVLASLSQIWVLPVGTHESLVGEDCPAFNLGGLYGLFALVTCALDDLVLDANAPLFEVWDRICQATLRAYDERRMSDWAFVLQVRILVYLMTALQITRLGESCLEDILEAARQVALAS